MNRHLGEPRSASLTSDRTWDVIEGTTTVPPSGVSWPVAAHGVAVMPLHVRAGVLDKTFLEAHHFYLHPGADVAPGSTRSAKPLTLRMRKAGSMGTAVSRTATALGGTPRPG